MSCLLCALIWPFLMCLFGTFATDRIESIGDIAYDSNWYEYPKEIRMHVMLIILRSQEPVYFMGFGVVRATLEVFGKVNGVDVRKCCFELSISSKIFRLIFFYSSSDHPARII